MKEMPITFSNYTDANESVQANRIDVDHPAGTPADHPYFTQSRYMRGYAWGGDNGKDVYYLVRHHLLCRYFPEVALDRHEAMINQGINPTHHTMICTDIIAGKYNLQAKKLITGRELPMLPHNVVQMKLDTDAEKVRMRRGFSPIR